MSEQSPKRKLSNCNSNDQDNTTEPSNKKRKLSQNTSNESNTNNNSQELSSEPLICTQETPSPTKTVKLEEYEIDNENLIYNDTYNDIHDGVFGLLIPTNPQYNPFQIKKDTFTIGRNGLNDLILERNAKDYESMVSNFHAKIEKYENKNVYLVDISTHGTHITFITNTLQYKTKTIRKNKFLLRNGCLIRCGEKDEKIQKSAYYYFNVRGYDKSEKQFDANNANLNFDVVLKVLNKKCKDNANKKKKVFKLEINGKHILEYDEEKYNEKYVTNIINTGFLNDVNSSKIIYDYYGNIMDQIAFELNKWRPLLLKPGLNRENCC